MAYHNLACSYMNARQGFIHDDYLLPLLLLITGLAALMEEPRAELKDRMLPGAEPLLLTALAYDTEPRVDPLPEEPEKLPLPLLVPEEPMLLEPEPRQLAGRRACGLA